MARKFGNTWWGRAWTDALEHRASLDPNRLPRGRTYARHGRVEDLDIDVGLVVAAVKGSRTRPYNVELRFRTFSDDEWTQLLEVIVAKVERTAALLDGELDPDLVEDARVAGVDLLPHAGELQPRCSCPDWADPCKHSAAVCYLVADALDVDPFSLLLMRGRDRHQVLAGVRRLRTGSSESTADELVGAGSAGSPSKVGEVIDEGVRASEAWKRPLGPLPAVPSIRSRPAKVASQAIDPPADAPFSATGIETLATDAAARAWSALVDEESLHLRLDHDDDLARRAARALGTDGWSDLCATLGARPRALSRRAIAWNVAGADGVSALSEAKWRVDPLTLAAARDAVVDAGVAPSAITIDGNRLTMGDEQLRLGRRGRTTLGRWWLFVKRGSSWELTAGPADDPAELIDL